MHRARGPARGLSECYQCRKPFTVRVGTIFESSKVSLHVWLQAIYFVAGSKKRAPGPPASGAGANGDRMQPAART